jgi:hypothetical protein
MALDWAGGLPGNRGKRRTHKMDGPEKKYILDTIGSAVGLIDYDNDGIATCRSSLKASSS